MAERGVACNVHYKPLPMMTAYKAMGFDIADYPNAYTTMKTSSPCLCTPASPMRMRPM